MPVPEWAKVLPWPIIREIADRYRLKAELVAAVIQTESGGNIYCMRAEVKKTMTEAGQILFVSTWRYFEEPDHFADQLKPYCSRPTEWVGQAMSFGPMQVMGGVAREHGFTGWLSQLCSWEIGVEYGCRHLRKKADRYGDDPAMLYASFNGGSPRRNALGMFENQKHVDNFMRNYNELVP